MLDELAGMTWLARRATGTNPGVWRARLLGDHRFRAEMRLCAAAGMPHSEFLGWSAEDQDKALAYQALEAERCGSCGVHPLEWEDESDVPFTVEGERCFACQALELWWEEARKHADAGTATMPGMKAHLRPVADDA